MSLNGTIFRDWFRQNVAYVDEEGPPPPEAIAKNRRVFIVFGRDRKLYNAVIRFLRVLNLEPIEWSEALDKTNNASATIKEIPIKPSLSHRLSLCCSRQMMRQGCAWFFTAPGTGARKMSHHSRGLTLFSRLVLLWRAFRRRRYLCASTKPRGFLAILAASSYSTSTTISLPDRILFSA